MRIIFMGTPEFAVPSLDILIKNRFNVVGVITATDKYGGRNRKTLIESPIKKYGLEKGLRILQPHNLKDKGFVEELRSLKADVQIVVAFRMLPEIVWDMPSLGTYNLHGSLLPEYRGAAPINWAIINGSNVTGVTSFKLKHAIDTGDVFLQRKIIIKETETAGQLHDKMKEIAAQVVLRTAKAIRSGKVDLIKQEEKLATKAPKIHREDCQINWENSNRTVFNLIRGLSPHPTAWTHLNDKTFKIFTAEKISDKPDLAAGTFKSDGKNYLHFASLDGYISCLDVQLQGKKRMDIKSFLNGNPL